MKTPSLLLVAVSVFGIGPGARAGTNCVAPPAGILSWWTADTDARDLAGLADGALVNGVTFAPGQVGQAFRLNGTNAYVRLPDNFFPFPPNAPAGTPFTFETWFQTLSGGVILGQQSGIPFASVSGWVPGIYVGTDGKLRVEVFWGGNASPVVTTQVVTDGVFHHVAVAYDGSNESTYLDGQLLNSRPFAQTSYASTYNYELGIGYTSGWPAGNGDWYPFKGIIDEATLYNRALSSSEIAAIYGAGSFGKCTNALPPVITQPPASFDAAVGASPTLTVGVKGALPLAYQWQFSGTNLPSATNATLTLPNLAAAQSGPYSVFITNAFGTAQSATGIVTVTFPIALDTVVSNGVPYVGAGNLEASGAQDVYSFDAPASRVAYFDVISAFNRLFWSLTAPDGSTVFSARYLPYDDTRRVELPMSGKYRLVVYSDSGTTGSYAFQIYSVTDQVFTTSVGSTVSNGVPALGAGNLEMPGSHDDYLFDAPANRIVYCNVNGAFNRLFWSLTAPDGSAVFSSHYMPNNDIGRLELPMPGTYRLRVFDDDIYTGAYSLQLLADTDQVFNIAVGDTVANGAPAAGAGNLETPGTWDDYLFTAPANRLVYFDVLSAPFRCFWTLYAPNGSTVFAGRYLPNNDTRRVALPEPGTYRLRVYGDNASTGAYGFRLTSITDQSFAINIGDIVTNGVPLTGAGNLEMPGAIDNYSFAAPTNQVIYFKVLAAPFRLFWTLTAPNGAAVFSGRYLPNDDVRRVELPMPGTYNLSINSDQDQTGAYSFKLWSVTDQSFAINVGDTVTNGLPAAGAGNLEMPGSVDEYVFAAPANRVVYFDVLSAPYRLWWELRAPDDAVLFSGRYMPNNDVRRVDLPLAGTYRLRVSSDVDQSGSYSFKLWNVVDQSFSITVGSVVTNGVPAAGAGVLSTAGEDDLYTFTANAGQRVLFNDRDASPRVATWWLVAPNGAGQIFSDTLNGGDPGTFTLPVTGTYEIHVRNTTSTTPVNYSFALLDRGTTNISPPTVDAFTISIGDTISNGVPALGAGNLETANARDIYTFTSGVGQVVFFQDLGGSPYRQLRYDVYDSQWNSLFGEWLGGDVEIGRQRLTRGGTYYLVASGNNNTATGTYTLKLWPVTDQFFAINIGDTVSSNSPATGAGVIESPGAQDTYTFTAAPGQVVYFEDRGATPYRQIRYDVYDDRGLWLFGEWLGGATDQEVGWRTLNRGGAYTIIVSASSAATGTYSFKLWSLPADQSFAINIGDTIANGVPEPGAGNLEAPGVRDLYTFTAAPNQEVVFQDLGATPYRQIRYDVYDSQNAWLFGEWLGGDSEVGRQTLTRGGTYTIIATAAQDYTGTYSLRLIAATNDQTFAINIGDAVTNGFPAAGAGNLSAPGELDTYTFTAAPGQIVFFEDWNCSSPGNMRYDVYDERGTPLFGEWLNGGQEIGRQVLSRGGTYKLIVSGYRDTTGTYGFKLWPITDQSFTLNIGDTISNGVPAIGAGNIETPGVRDLYTFTAAPEQRVYFEDRAASSPGNLRYDLYDQDGNALTGEWLGNGQQVGLFRLSRGGTYSLVASGYKNITGNYTLRVWDALPRILQPPVSVRGAVGQGQTFTVKAESPSLYALAYQWRLFGTNLPGATNVILSLASPALNQAGPYDVIVGNQNGAVTSVVATLTLDAAEFFVNAFSPSGPVNTNVSQLLVQFNSPVATGQFGKRDIQVTGPGGPLDSGFFTITQLDPQTFSIGLFPQSAKGAYTVTIGPAITNQAGVPMTGGAFSALYSTDFETGAGPAWSRGETATNTISARYFGEFSNDSATLFLAGLPPHNQLRLIWDALILDTWDGNLNGGPDYFGFNLTGLPQPAWEYTFHSSGNPLVQSYPGTPDVSFVNFGGIPSYNDCLYRNLRFDFPHTNGTLEVSFYGRNLEGVNNEGWGLDNVRVLTVASSNGVFTGRFVIDKTGPLVAGISPSGTVILPVNQLVVTFNEPVQPQTVTTSTVALRDPSGNAIALSSPVRLSATDFQFSFAAQRANGTYTATIGPTILDLAGNGMSAAAVRTFNLLTPPVIATQPVSQTIVRNNTVTFTVAANTTPPTSYQWTFNGAPIANATNASLTLLNVQTNQSGAYAVTVTDAGGSATSSAATLTVLQTYGPFIAQSQAARSSVPAVPGNGVFIELYNHVGGSGVPVPDTIQGHVPDGTTLSPFIQFPNPGPAINLGNTFDSFFATTTIPPDQVRGLQTANFTLRLQFYLAVKRSLDLHPETPEIDVQLGVGSDDGFYLLVGTNYLGSAGDRGFTYTWMDVSFQDEGLYPVTLFYDDNGVGPLGLQFAWNIAGTNQIIPQKSLYISPDLGDRLITFEEFPAGTVLGSQYAATGVVFTTISGTVQVTTNFPARFVPVSPTQVFGDPTTNPAAPGTVDLTFVAPGTTNPATSDFVSLFMINGQNDAATVTAFDSGGHIIFTNSYHGGGAAQELVSINQRGIARVRLNLGSGTNTAAIDNLAFLTPVSLPDLVVDQLAVPATVIVGQPVQVSWRVTNQGLAPAQGPWTDTISLSADPLPGGDQLLVSTTYSNLLPVGASLTVTQSVIMPVSQAGNRWFVVTANAGHAFTESGSLTNNTAVAPAPTHVLAPDLAVQNLTVPASAQFGQTISVSWVVQNAGTAPAAVAWNDRVYFSAFSNSLSGATTLLTAPALTALVPSASYTNTRPVTLPLSGTLAPGTYFLIVQTDPDGAVLEPNLANNLLATPITITLPPLPDLIVGQASSPASGIPGQLITVSWAVTNIGAAPAIGAWRESIYLTNSSAGGTPAVLLGAFTFTNNLASGAGVTRTQSVTIPLNGPAGSLRLLVVADSDNDLLEANEANNSALAANTLQIPAALFLSVPVTNVTENTASPNLAGLVSRNGDLTSPVVVSLASSATNHLSVPATVTIGGGAPSAPFSATVLDDGVFGPDVWVALSAQAGGFIGATAQVFVVNTDLPRLALVLASPQIIEGQTVAATVTRDVVNNQPVTVTLASSSPTRLTGPASITIPANSNSASFTLLAVDNTVIEPTHIYTVSASASGYASASTNLTVFDNDTPALSLSLDRTNISEGDGPLAAIGTITRAPVTDQPLTVALASSNTAAALVPAQITIAPLAAQASFYVAAVNDTNVTGPKLTLISAQTLDALNEPVGTPATQLLAVQDENGPTLHVRLTDKVLRKITDPANTGLVWRNTPPTNNLVVTLTSSDPNVAWVQQTVTIPAGQTNATFAVAGLGGSLSNFSTTVLITASAPNFASGSDTLTVTDFLLPDLVVASITTPAAAYTAEPLTLSFRLSNQGLGAMTNSVSQSVYLTADPSSGNNTLVGAVPFAGPLAAGQYVDQSLVVPGSALVSPGNLWVVVVADAGASAAELNEANNTAISAAPIAVSSEYTATVKVGVTNAVAGTLVPLTGSATLVAGGPAANKQVNLLLTVRGLQRTFSVMTDASGNFSTVFTPLPAEAGHYTVAAVAPGVTSAPAQDQFNILGLTATPASLALTVTEGGNASGAVTLRNTGDLPLTGLSALVNGLAANLSATAVLGSNVLAAQSSGALTVTISASDATIQQSAFTIRVASAEGVSLDLPVNVTVQALQARLVSSPPQLAAAMLRGGQTIVQFDLVNAGGAASGPLAVNVPAVPWLSVASTNPLPSLAPGDTNHVTLVLTPAPDLALGPYTGVLTVSGSGTGLQVPFTFTAVSDAHGALRVHSTDEFTYFASGSPPLTNASVTLIEPFSRSVIATGVTDTNGIFFATNLTEGTYELDVTADKHAAFKGSATVFAARTNDMEAFLSRQTVTYTWTVVPTEVQDVTHITVQAEFEANVPAPVVVPSPASLDLSTLDTPGKFMDVPFTLANYGLIAVHGVTIQLNDNPLYRFDLLTRDIGILPAHGTVTVPMRITRLAGSAKKGDPCSLAFGVLYLYLCGSHDISNAIGIPVFGLTGDCGGGGGGTIVVVGGPGGPGGPIVIPPGQSGPTDCDPCMTKALIECAIGFTPAGCAYGGWSCGLGINNKDPNAAENCVNQLVGCLGGPWGNAASCLWSFFRCKCPGTLAQAAACASRALGGGRSTKDDSVGLGLSPVDPRDVYAARSYYGLQWLAMILGDADGRWFSAGSGGALGAWMNGFSQTIQTNSPSGMFVSLDELTTLLALPRPNGVTLADVQATVSRWNLSLSNWDAHIYSTTNVPAGGDTNFIDLIAMGDVIANANQQDIAAQQAGYSDPIAGFFAALNDAKTKIGGGGVCARVVLQLDQDAVLTRDAFKATLELNNAGADPLLNVSVNLTVKNAVGQDVTGVFGIYPPTLTGALTGVDGTGVLAPNGTGSAQWTLIPTIDAAPQAATNLLVSGTFSYSLNGVTITIPLASAPIAVQPNPRLFVKYFHQRDVFADDPFTPAIELSIPYSLAVIVQNRGYGTARNFHIISAQPKIVDNEKGLLIDFKIIGSQVGTNAVAPSLTVDFGDIPPGQLKIGRWLLTSTLQGLFIDYKATFQHVDPLGNPRLSLIEGVEIHELVHLVRAPGALDDGLPDFLVNDVPDFNDLPDTLHLSDGSIQPVSVVQSATTDGPAGAGHLLVQLTANFPPGFTYVRVPDPGNGQFFLTGVRRANGTNLLSENVWTTDRTFIGLGQKPIRENILHLFDSHTNTGPETYTLVYASPASVPDTNPPVSAVFSLPARSPQTFGVVWSGADYAGESGLAWFDIFVSDNSGPFTLWQPHTTSTGALFSGAPGHTYAFYSIATDNAGNVEAPPATPDAVTTVSLSNTPPTITLVSDLTVNEGDTVSISPTVADPDLPPETFTFALGPGAPAGARIDPSSGLVTWPTTELDGPGTNFLKVIVTDNGFPPLSATGTVRVVVNEVNSAPLLAPIADRTINEGQLLSITNVATDYDIPTNTLTFSLVPGAPPGAAINPTNGVFTWRPTSTQGPSTNRLAVVVTDNGVPPLSATQSFTVIVRDVLPDVTLSLGQTNLFAGETGAMPLTLVSTLELTNLAVRLSDAALRLTNFSLQAAAPEVTSATLQSLGSNAYTASFVLNPALQVSATRTLAQLGFQAVTNPHSAIVPLAVAAPLARRADGQAVSNTAGVDGRIIVVATEPVLDIGAGPTLTLYGHPEATAVLQLRTNLTTAPWLDFNRLTIADRRMRLTNLPPAAPVVFYRAFEVSGLGLSLQSPSHGVFTLALQGQPGARYTVQAATNLTIPMIWSDLFSLTLTNGVGSFSLTNPGSGALFLRGVDH